MKRNFIDVTEEYIKNIQRNISKITYEGNYRFEKHVDEIIMAKWIVEKFGGEILLCDEINHNNIKSCDYIWRGKMWDLKRIISAKAANSAIRKGVLQIIENPGGIFIDIKCNDIDVNDVIYHINDRMRRIYNIQIDIVIVCNEKLIKVIRYKKRD